MGCAHSRVLPPASDAKRRAPKTQDSRSSIPASQPDTEANSNLYPLHAMRMADFLALTCLEPHNALVAKGLVVALDFKGEHAGVRLNFISHQWLGYAEADPECAHLHTMQTLFRRVIAGESIFRSEEDWNAYSRGFTAENARSASTKHASASDKGSFGEEESVMRSESNFLASIADGWVWMDYISIPQTIGCESEEETLRVLADQQRAIEAIPQYVQHAQNFWICAPSNARHCDTGIECNYETWLARGWCRMEEAVLNLIRLGDGRPLLVTQPLGEPPRVKTLDKIDRAWNMTQRHSAVLTGAFSCCRLHHQVTSHDGSVTSIPCDKEKLKSVLCSLFERQLDKVRAALPAERAESGGLAFEKRVGASMKGSVQAFWNLWTFVTLKPTILADEAEEPDFVARGWSPPFEQLTRADYVAYCHDGLGPPGSSRQGGYDSEPTADLEMMSWNAAMMGHLPMLRYCIEREGADPTFKNAFGMSQLMMSGRFGHASCLRYLCERLVQTGHPQEIDYTSAGLGLSALGDAAKCGHAKCIQVLLHFRAAVDPRRKNGKTPLHEAAAAGYAECVRLLVDAGADTGAVDDDGKTPRDLAAESMPVRRTVLEILAAGEKRETRQEGEAAPARDLAADG